MTLQINTSFKSPNFNDRPGGFKPSAIVCHSTEGIWASDLRWLCSKSSQVSCHYVISPTGEVFQIVDDAKRAWHAGVGSYLGINDWNTVSIGIELSHVKGHPTSAEQRAALTELCRIKIAAYGIKQSMIAAHRWIAPDRRSDPTDWPDSDFRAWIKSLYITTTPIDHYLQAWGTEYEFRPTFGIPQRWIRELDHGNDLGAATSDETPVGGWKVQGFQDGVIAYKDGETWVSRK